MSFLNKRVTNKGLIIGLIIALAVVVAGGFITAGFTIFKPDEIRDYLAPEVNVDNFYTVEYLTKEDTNTGDGVKIDFQDNGSIKLSGKATSDITLDFATFSLNKGEYTFTAVENGTKATYYVSASVGGQPINADFTPTNTFTVNQDNTAVTLTLHSAKDTVVDNIVIYPVIVSGDEAGNFFE